VGVILVEPYFELKMRERVLASGAINILEIDLTMSATEAFCEKPFLYY
jgi:hypothetical protein